VQIETVSLLEVIAAARSRHASLVPETAGYVTLALGRALAGVPMRLDLDHLRLSTEGTVTIDGPREARPTRATVTALQRLLTELLDLSRGYAPALRAATEPGAFEEGPDAFFSAVAKALIPINRAAAKRSLARLARETAKARQTGMLDRPSLDLDLELRPSDLDVRSPARPAPRAAEAPARRPAREESRDHATPSPPAHSASLTPTFVDSDVATEGMSFREALMRNVVGFIAKDVKTARPAGSDHVLLDHDDALLPVPDERLLERPGASALDILDRRAEPARPRDREPSDDRERASRVPKRFVPKRGKIQPKTDDGGLPYVATSVETLLERFAEAPQDAPSLRQVEKSLGQLGSLHMTPIPNGTEEAPISLDDVADRAALTVDGEGTPSVGSVEADPAWTPAPDPSRASSTPSGQAFGHEQSSVPPLFLDRISRHPRRLVAGMGVVLAAAAALGGVALVRPDLLRRLNPSATVAAAAPVCSAEVTLKDLPEQHELLLRLGAAPFTTHAVPQGVRLELVAMAPSHQPQRLTIDKTADWHSGVGGLQLDASLEPATSPTWPSAPEGEVGGTGPAGQLAFSATPVASELWLVLHAGSGTHQAIRLPCDATAHLVALDPAEPSNLRRAQLDPELLRAAARNGEAEVAMVP